MTSAKSKKRGRPSLYTDKLAAKICRRLAEGETLRSVCRDEAMPDKATVAKHDRIRQVHPVGNPNTDITPEAGHRQPEKCRDNSVKTSCFDSGQCLLYISRIHPLARECRCVYKYEYNAE